MSLDIHCMQALHPPSAAASRRQLPTRKGLPDLSSQSRWDGSILGWQQLWVGLPSNLPFNPLPDSGSISRVGTQIFYCEVHNLKRMLTTMPPTASSSRSTLPSASASAMRKSCLAEANVPMEDWRVDAPGYVSVGVEKPA